MMHRSICQARVAVSTCALRWKSDRYDLELSVIITSSSTRFDSIRAFAHDRGSRQQL